LSTLSSHIESETPGLYTESDGEFAGWQTWKHPGFLTNSGPFWHRIEADGSARCAFRVEAKHLNGMGYVHGGCYMTFADYSLFAFIRGLNVRAVTVSFTCEFIAAAREGDLVEATGAVTHAGSSLIFLRGMMTNDKRPLFTYSATLKTLKPKS
jgi:uncharacterized protein (TIGR00369 family)